MKILIVDDAAIMRSTIKNILSSEEFDIVEADSGKSAICQYGQERPDLVIMDIIMPEMSGIEALKAIKLINPKAFVIMCSSVGYNDMLKEATDAGAMDFVIKPFEKDDLQRAVQHVRALMQNS